MATVAKPTVSPMIPRIAPREDLNPFRIAQIQFDMAAEFLKLDPGLRQILRAPKRMSKSELERMTRRFASEILPLISPDQDIPAPDVYTDAQTMAWIMDTYSMMVGHTVPGVVTGKPMLMFFPGRYEQSDTLGSSLVLFGRLKDDQYYRAKNILEQEA